MARNWFSNFAFYPPNLSAPNVGSMALALKLLDELKMNSLSITVFYRLLLAFVSPKPRWQLPHRTLVGSNHWWFGENHSCIELGTMYFHKRSDCDFANELQYSPGLKTNVFTTYPKLPETYFCWLCLLTDLVTSQRKKKVHSHCTTCLYHVG